MKLTKKESVYVQKLLAEVVAELRERATRHDRDAFDYGVARGLSEAADLVAAKLGVQEANGNPQT